MYLIEQLKAPLGEKDIKKFEFLLDVRERPLLRNSETLIWLALFKEEPIGIVILVNAHLPFSSEIHSLFVLPAHRNQRVGSRLLSCAEAYLKEKGGRYSTLFFRYSRVSAFGNEKFLKAKGWNSSICSSLLYMFHRSLFNPPWLHLYEKTLPSPFREVPWKQVQEKDRAFLRILEKESAFPFYVSPFKEEEFVESLNSLAVYKGEEEVVGWLITHRIQPYMIRYQAFFFENRLQHTGIPMKILCDSIKRQIDSKIPYALVEINISVSEPDWLRFAYRRLAPYAQALGFIRQSWKQLPS